MPFPHGLDPTDPDQFYACAKRRAARERRQAMQSLMRAVFGRRNHV